MILVRVDQNLNQHVFLKFVFHNECILSIFVFPSFLWFPFRSILNVMWFIFNNLNRICVISCTWMYGFLNIHVQRCSKMHKFFLVEQNEYWLTPNWLKSVQIKPQILFFVIETVNAFNRKVHSKENHKKLEKVRFELDKS